MLQVRLDELEAVANKLQQDLLAELLGGGGSGAGAAGGGGAGAGPAASGGAAEGGAGASCEGKAAGGKKKKAAAKKAAAAAAAAASASASAAAATPAAAEPVAGKVSADAGAAARKAKTSEPAPPQPQQQQQPAVSKAARSSKQQQAAANAAAPAPAAEAAHQLDGDDASWQTVSSHKCAAKSRQQQQQQDQHEATVSTAPSSKPSGSGVAARPPAGPKAPAQVPHSYPAAASGQVPAGSRPGSASSATSSQSAAPAAAGKAAAAGAAKKQPLLMAPAVVDVAGACSAAPTVASGVCRFKAALLGASDVPAAAVLATAGEQAVPAATPCASASVAAAVHLLAPPIATSAASVASAVHAERKPAWGGVKAPAAAAVAAVNVAASPRSYPPLAATVTGVLSSGPDVPSTAPIAGAAAAAPVVPAPPPRALPQTPAAPPQTPAAGLQTSAFAPAPPPAASGGSSHHAGCDTGSTAPPSVASVAESEVGSSTGHSTCSHPGHGASSPRSFGHHILAHDWTRPSPVDVLLQAALAASSTSAASVSHAAPGAMAIVVADPQALRPPQPAHALQPPHPHPGCHHSKTNSAASSGALSSGCGFDAAVGGSTAGTLTPGSVDGLAVQQAVAAPAAAPAPVTAVPVPTAASFGVGALGGTEVPPPRRSGCGEYPSGSSPGVGDGSLRRLSLGSSSAAVPLAMAPPAPATGKVMGVLASSLGAAGATAVAHGGGGGGGAQGSSSMSEVARLKAEQELLHRRLRKVGRKAGQGSHERKICGRR